ncbi:aspartyl-phosphate phosphatase Spo0E family protein [Lederbergia graminis]|uniref:Aspartyl-phosphate phosphatase Spo0E family protein n=1 Tax=Lederbergia graminis TaxID=735518 RepID=A0ABW0LDI3_9BACI|nr:aspartyl-phosphate phosphatase Spo0E family protein [Paenibacillus bovis]HLU22323.1 aspartyl-phosphate phosphatase Spo0E family protein [Bacillaceae bacterium]
MHFSSKEQMRFLIRIQKKRELMCILGEVYGLNATETIKCSQELDALLNEYYHLFQAPTNKKKSSLPLKSVSNIFSKQQHLLLTAK